MLSHDPAAFCLGLLIEKLAGYKLPENQLQKPGQIPESVFASLAKDIASIPEKTSYHRPKDKKLKAS